MKLTHLELSVLRAIDNSEYGSDSLTSPTWTFSVTDNMQADGATPKQLPGVISSLSKKGLVSICDEPGEESIGMTDAGAAAYILAVGYERNKANADNGETWEAFKAQKKTIADILAPAAKV
jgi:hypothetical protein